MMKGNTHIFPSFLHKKCLILTGDYHFFSLLFKTSGISVDREYRNERITSVVLCSKKLTLNFGCAGCR